MFSFFALFSSLSVLSATFVVISNNPVYSVLFLVLSFFNVSSLLFLLLFEFLPVVFIVVYVGAIAVLFLFVIMTLNIKLNELKNDNLYFAPILTLFLLVFILNTMILSRLEFVPLFHSVSHTSLLSDFSSLNVSLIAPILEYTKSNNMKIVSSVIFVDFNFHFVLIGMVLLFAMISSIILTLQKSFIAKNQNAFVQTLRDTNSSIFIYR